MKRRERSAKFKELQRKMRASHTKCHHCTALATELHHIIAMQDGGTDDESNLMPLCRDCHQEYTSDQISERNRLWVQLTVKDDGEVLAQCKGEQPESLGNWGKMELKHEREEPPKTNNKIEKEMERVKAAKVKLEGQFLDYLNATGAEHVGTPHGTVYRNTQTSAKFEDREVFRAYVQEHDLARRGSSGEQGSN